MIRVPFWDSLIEIDCVKRLNKVGSDLNEPQKYWVIGFLTYLSGLSDT